MLAEQPGLNIAQDFSGSGVQVQGFDPDYTLILLDGSPVIGRTAGTLELTRFAVGNIERVEIVKGPTSSLYGSEALAGVINLITRTPRAPLALGLSGKIGEFNAREVATNLEMRRKFAVQKQRRAEPRPQGDDHLESLAFNRAEALHIGVIDDPNRLSQALLKRSREIESAEHLGTEIRGGDYLSVTHYTWKPDGDA